MNPSSPPLQQPVAAPHPHWVRVFAVPGQPQGGNPAPVWLDADKLSTQEMQARAFDSGHETVFVLQPLEATTHAFHMRYFVPRHEMEMCGHATIGALWQLRTSGLWDGTPVAIETHSGTVHGRWADDMVEISQPRGQVLVLDEAARLRIARCLNLSPEAIVGPVMNAATSRVKTLIELHSPQALHGLGVNFSEVEAVCESIGSTGLYPFARWQGGSNTVSARQFPKSSGYPEDAATGIAAAALAWGLRARGSVTREAATVRVQQGEAMGSPSVIWVRLPTETEVDTNEGCWLRGDAIAMEAPHGDA